MTLLCARLSGPSRFFFAGVSAVFFWALSACSDGPDKTGLAYLQSQKIQLSTKLYHFTFNDFPVDSLFSTELPLGHFGDSLLMVGRDGPFTASARMGFQITTQAQRDSVARGFNLRLVALPAVVNGYSYLQSSTANHDSLTVLIEAYAWHDTLGTYSDSLTAFHRRLLASFTPFSTMDAGHRVRDTARIALKAAYMSGTADSLQVCALPNLRNRLQTDTAHNWQVFLEISPLVKAGAAVQDSGMFRFVGENGAAYDPGLLLGQYQKGTAPSPYLLVPYTASGVHALNYQVTHSGSVDKLLYGVSRGVNFRLNRDALLNLIRDSLSRRDSSLAARYFSSAVSRFDSRFYVPYAEIHLPLADSLSRVDGRFALDMQMISDLDSLDPQSSMGLIPVNLNDSLTLFPLQAAAGSYVSSVADSLVCAYRKLPSDTSLRQVILHWVRETAIQDTFVFSADGKRHEVGLKRHSGWFKPAILGLYPNAGNVQLEVYFNIGAGVEPNSFVDAATGVSSSDLNTLSARFWRPGATSLNLRATRGVSVLLNRASGAIPEFLLSPVDRNAYTRTADSTSYVRVSYPVLGEIGFPRTNGKVRVTIDVYLYPLRSGR